MTTTRDIVEGWVDEAARAGSPDAYAAKRGKVRYECHWPMEMRYRGLTHQVVSRDFSPGGVGLTSPQEVVAGEYVQLRRKPDDPWVGVRIMHATRTVGRFKLGGQILFEDVPATPATAAAQSSDRKERLVAQSLLALAEIMIQRGNYQQAEAIARDCVRVRQAAFPPDHWQVAHAESVVGECLVHRGCPDAAEALLRRSHDALRAQLGDADPHTVDASRRMQLLEASAQRPR